MASNGKIRSYSDNYTKSNTAKYSNVLVEYLAVLHPIPPP